MNCPHCKAKVTPGPSPIVRWAVVLVAWILSMATVFAGIMLGPGIITILPIIVPGGMATITAAHVWAFSDRVCDNCGKAYELDGRLVAAVAS